MMKQKKFLLDIQNLIHSIWNAIRYSHNERKIIIVKISAVIMEYNKYERKGHDNLEWKPSI